MPSSFGQYQSGIEAATGNLVPAYAKMAEQTANSLTGLGQNVAEGIKQYAKNRDESEFLDAKAETLANNVLQFKNIIKDNPRFKAFGDTLDPTLEQLSGFNALSLSQKRGKVSQLEHQISQIGNQFQMYNYNMDSMDKQNINKGILATPDTTEEINNLKSQVGVADPRKTINENIRNAEIKFDSQVLVNKEMAESKGMKYVPPEKSAFMKDWAKANIKMADSATGINEDVKTNFKAGLESYLAEQDMTEDEKTNPDALFNADVRNYSPTQLAIAGLPKDQIVPETGINVQDAISNLKLISLKNENEQLISSIPQIDNKIKELANPERKMKTDWNFGGEEAMPYYDLGIKPPTTENVVGGIKSPSQIKQSVSNIESLTSQKEAMLKSIENNKKQIQKLEQTPVQQTSKISKQQEAELSKPITSAVKPSVDFGQVILKREIESAEKKKSVAKYITEVLGAPLPPDFNKFFSEASPENSFSIQNKNGMDFLVTADGKITHLPREKGMSPSEISKQKTYMYGQVDANGNSVPAELVAGSGIKLAGNVTAGTDKRADEIRTELTDAAEGIKLIRERLLPVYEKNAVYRGISPSEADRILPILVSLRAKSRKTVIGTGSQSNIELEALIKANPNPTALLNWIGDDKGKTETILSIMEDGMRATAESRGLQMIVDYPMSAQDTVGASAEEKFNNRNR